MCVQEVISKLTRVIDVNDKVAEQVETTRVNSTLIITQAFEQLHQPLRKGRRLYILLSEMEAIHFPRQQI